MSILENILPDQKILALVDPIFQGDFWINLLTAPISTY